MSPSSASRMTLRLHRYGQRSSRWNQEALLRDDSQRRQDRLRSQRYGSQQVGRSSRSQRSLRVALDHLRAASSRCSWSSPHAQRQPPPLANVVIQNTKRSASAERFFIFLSSSL